MLNVDTSDSILLLSPTTEMSKEDSNKARRPRISKQESHQRSNRTGPLMHRSTTCELRQRPAPAGRYIWPPLPANMLDHEQHRWLEIAIVLKDWI